MTDGGKGRCNRIRCPNTLPVPRREIIKRQQIITVFFQAPGRFGIFRLIGVNEGAQSPLRLFPLRRLPDIAQRPLGLGLHGFGQAVQHVSGLMHPAALIARARVDFIQRRPKSQRPVASCISSETYGTFNLRRTGHANPLYRLPNKRVSPPRPNQAWMHN